MKSNTLQGLKAKVNERIMVPPLAVRFPNWPLFDNAIKGLRPREYTIFCGTSGSGKTAFLADLANELARQDIPTYVASVETGQVDFATRMYSARIGKNWNLGDPVPPDEVALVDAEHLDFWNSPTHIAIYEDRVSNEELLGEIQYHVQEKGVKVAILDNLNFFMEVVPSHSQLLEMDRVIHDMIIFCKQVDVHLIVVMHPRKTENGRVESEYDVKGSSTAVQEAHNVLLWNRLPADLIKGSPQYRNFRQIKIAKCRRFGHFVGENVTFWSKDGVCFEERAINERTKTRASSNGNTRNDNANARLPYRD